MRIYTSGFIRVSPVFFILLTLMIALGYAEQFFMLLFCASIHEAAHILAANCFFVKVNRLYITAFGLIAELVDFELASYSQKIIILISGPLANLILFLLFKGQFSELNIALFIFNLLPICPLDGGKLLFELLCRKGVLYSAAKIKQIGECFCMFITILGFIQIALFPYNLSLIGLAHYLKHNLRQEYICQITEFHKVMFGAAKSKNLKSILVTVSQDSSAAALFRIINYHENKRFTYQSGENIEIIDEAELLELFVNNELQQSLSELSAKRNA